MIAALARARDIPLWGHVGLLAVALLLLLPLLDDGSVSADEGALFAQLDLLDRTGEWTAPNPSPDVDPELEALPLENGYRAADGRWAPFNKHAAHLAVLRPLFEAGGTGAVLAVSVLGAVVAAATGGLLTGRLQPDLGWVAVWATGLGTPLLFDSYLAIGHTTSAAIAGAAALAALGAFEARSGARRGLAAATAVVLAVTGGLVRSEAVLLAIALGVGAAAVALPGLAARSTVMWRALGLAVGFVLAGVATLKVVPVIDERAWPGPALGGILAGDRDRPPFLDARWEALRTTWLKGGYQSTGAVPLTLLGVAGVWVAAVLARRRVDPALVRGVAVVAAALVATRLIDDPSLVPGLLVATPLLAGVVGLRRADLEIPTVRFLLAACGAFAAAVLATQYAEGGAGEWGGRYFALALPLVVPLALLGWRSLGLVLPPAAPALHGAVVVAALALAVVALRTVDDLQEGATRNVEAIEALRAEVGGAEPASILTTEGAAGRFAWEHLDEGSWHTVAATRLATYSERLAALDQPIVFFTRDPHRYLPVVEEDWTVEPAIGTTVFVLRPR